MAKKPTRQPSPTPEGEKPKTPTKEELLKLPRWARVAFAARCARRAQPLFVKHWPKAPKKHVEAVDKAITLTESSARAGRADEDAAAAAAYDARAAADAARADAAAIAFTAADDAAAAIAFAAAADDDDDDAAFTAAAIAFTAAAIAFADAAAHDAAAATQRDFGRLLTLAREEKWTDDTPVDPDWLGPIGNIDEADSVCTTRAPQPDDVLELTLRVPAAASDEEIKLLVKQFVLSASKYHLAHGGSGLKPGTVEVYAVAASPAGVPA